MLPNYFSDPQKRYNTVQTNPRYNFYQTHFTAGDEGQFEEHRDRSNSSTPASYHTPDIPRELFWEKFESLNTNSVSNTFRYLFYKFKKGIYVRIKNNKLHVFLPFSNANFRNEWGKNIQVPEYFFEDLYHLDNKPYNQKKISQFTNEWYANNSLVRYEFPLTENDSGIPVLCDMLQTLCETRSVPDIEFFINKRDYPLIRKDGHESYKPLFGDIPLVSHAYDSYCPILGMCTTDEHADIPIPTWDDWGRVSLADGKHFQKCPQEPPAHESIDWDDKKPIAVFRGTSNGLDIHDNPRVKLCLMESELIDAGLTKWNVRPRVGKDFKLETFPESLVETLRPKPYLSFAEQCQFKYIINVDGHVTAFRLSKELGSGSVVLKVESPYKIWFSDYLIPYDHYIPIASDLGDLEYKIRWCIDHDDRCKEIAYNAYKLYHVVLSKQGILTRLSDLLWDLKIFTGEVKYPEPKEQIIPEMPNEICTEGKETKLYESKKTVITVLNKDIICKRANTTGELENEAFIGLTVINNLHSKFFSTTFGYKENTLYLQYYPVCETFYSWLVGNRFSMKRYTYYLREIALALELLQPLQLTHNDLYPWNILLSEGRPIIIDFGKAFISDETLRFVPVQDMLCILVSSLHVILEKRILSRDELKSIFNMALLFSGGKYTDGVAFTTVKELRRFLSYAKKFAVMSTAPKFELGSKTPLELLGN